MSKKPNINQGVALDERETRGLNKMQMADVLGIEGAHAEQILSDFETGFRQIKGPTLRLYQGLNRARWSVGKLLGLPKWSVDRDDPGGPTIHHNDWPRFVGKAFAAEIHPEQWQFTKAGMPSFALDARSGFRQLVVAFVDHVPPDFDPASLVADAAQHLENLLIGDSHGN